MKREGKRSMDSPDNFAENMFAPCGVNCAICYVHANPRKYGKACGGCLADGQGKPQHCLTCKIKQCIAEKGATHCFNCGNMPCKLVKNLDKSYRKRYRVSIVENNLAVLKSGISQFMVQERDKWTCSHCGGAISLQDGICGECKKPRT